MKLWRACLFVALYGCEEVGPPPITEPQTLGGEVVSVETLNEGRKVYEFYCRGCHGPFGDGKGALGVHQEPPARDLRLGIMKFAAVQNGSLPRDEDIKRVVLRGIPGTAMLPWQVGDANLDVLVQYVKTFSPRWRSERAGEPIRPGPDPWIGREAEAVARGEALYYGRAACVTCHPAHVTRQRAQELAGGAELRGDLQTPAISNSAYGPIAATDFAKGPLRGGSELSDLYRAIAAGIGGTAMPAWKGALPEDELWALAYYVRSL